VDFPQKIKCLVFHAVCASKELKIPSAQAEVVAKSVGDVGYFT